VQSADDVRLREQAPLLIQATRGATDPAVPDTSCWDIRTLLADTRLVDILWADGVGQEHSQRISAMVSSAPAGGVKSTPDPSPDVAAGDYRMWCDVQGHAAGQTGALVVTPATEPATTSA
jgi:hypothetical protein